MVTVSANPAELARIISQRSIPVGLRSSKKGEKLRVGLPFDALNRVWLQNGRRSKPKWDAKEKFWVLPKSWFNDFVVRSLERYGQVYIVQPYREQEVCAPACMNAAGHECQCSCMGANHGAGNDGSWFEVSETFAARWNDEELASRLLVSK